MEKAKWCKFIASSILLETLLVTYGTQFVCNNQLRKTDVNFLSLSFHFSLCTLVPYKSAWHEGACPRLWKAAQAVHCQREYVWRPLLPSRWFLPLLQPKATLQTGMEATRGEPSVLNIAHCNCMQVSMLAGYRVLGLWHAVWEDKSTISRIIYQWLYLWCLV